MKIISYSPAVTRELAVILATEPSVPTTFDERTLVAADGYWQPGDWRTDLARAVTAGHPLSAVGFRQGPDERTLASREWADIARRLLVGSGSQYAPWVAVRTGPRSMVVLAASGHRMRPAALRDFIDTVNRGLNQVEPRRSEARPMRILDACHTDRGELAVLVDHKPDPADLRFTPHLVHDELRATRHPLPHTLYLGQHPDGYILDLFDNGDGRGFNGEPFDLQLVDGTCRTVVGPYTGYSATQVARYIPDVYLGQVSLHEDPRQFRDSPSSGSGAVLTNPAAQRALFKAARHITRPHPAVVARASYPPERSAPSESTDIADIGPPDRTGPRHTRR